MSALSELLNAVGKYGPEAAAALMRAGGRSAQEIENALKTVGVTLTQSGNPAGRKILEGLGQGATATEVTKATRRRLVQSLSRQEAARQAARNLPPPAPKPQFNVRERGGQIVTTQQPRVSPRRQIAPGSDTASRIGNSNEPYGAVPVRLVNVVDVTEIGRPNLPMMTEASRSAVPRPEGFTAGRQLNLGVGSRRQGYGVPRGKGQPSPEYLQSVERARLGLQPSIADTPRTGFSGVSPGQLSLEDLGRTEPMGPLSRQLAARDLGTYQSVSDIAQRASSALGRNITPEDLLGPQGTLLLRGSNLTAESVNPVTADVLDNLYKGLYNPRSARGGLQDILYPSMPKNPALVDAASRLRVPRFGIPDRAAALGVATGGAIAGGATAYLLRDPKTGEQVEVAVDPATGLIDVAAASRAAFPGTANLGKPPAAPNLPPATGSATGGIPGQTGPAVIRINDGASNQRQAQANAVQGTVLMPDRMTGNAADYYAQRKAYVSQPGVMENIMERLVAMDTRYGDPTSGLAQWAAANPTLAYELSQKSAPRDISQQSQNVQSTVITTPLGTNPRNNPIGNSVEAANVAVDGADPALRDATAPQTSVMLQKLPMPQEINARQNFEGAQPGIADEFYNSVRGLRGPTGDFVRPNRNRLVSIITGMG